MKIGYCTPERWGRVLVIACFSGHRFSGLFRKKLQAAIERCLARAIVSSELVEEVEAIFSVCLPRKPGLWPRRFRFGFSGIYVDAKIAPQTASRY